MWSGQLQSARNREGPAGFEAGTFRGRCKASPAQAPRRRRRGRPFCPCHSRTASGQRRCHSASQPGPDQFQPKHQVQSFRRVLIRGQQPEWGWGCLTLPSRYGWWGRRWVLRPGRECEAKRRRRGKQLDVFFNAFPPLSLSHGCHKQSELLPTKVCVIN